MRLKSRAVAALRKDAAMGVTIFGAAKASASG
jgi:hypothetical protein